MGDQSEKRAAKRVGYLCEVECEGADNRRFQTRISDLSTDGAFVDSITTYPGGSLMKLKFIVRSTEIRVTAQVRYCMPQIGMGVCFVDLTPGDRAVIADLVAEVSR
jgi:hypothetical protein